MEGLPAGFDHDLSLAGEYGAEYGPSANPDAVISGQAAQLTSLTL
jgi:hypothetical protein